MTRATRQIGLSLGADICWPICYEQLLQRLELELDLGDEVVDFAVSRLTIEPFSLRQAVRYDLVIDRLTHWYQPSREWIKKAVIMNGLYVFNNPWSLQSMEKQTTYCAMMRLGLPIPDTWLIPPKAYDPSADLQPTLERYARWFDLGEVGKELGYPLFMKPYSGGGWVGVSKIDNEEDLREAYEKSGKLVMHLQAAVLPHDGFVRCIGLGPQIRIVNYDPTAPLHDRYQQGHDILDPADMSLLQDMTVTINSFFGWDFNSCEALHQGAEWYPIDFANACPDSQVTSLHYHFPWLLLANVRWSLYCAATKRRMPVNLNWPPYYEIADSGLPYREKLRAYARLAHEKFETERFQEFCARHLPHLNEVACDFFGSSEAEDAVRKKVTALFPQHEIDEFTELFFGRIQRWIEIEGGIRDSFPDL